MTADEIVREIALIFNHSKNVNQDYIRLTFATLEEGAKGGEARRDAGHR